MVSWWVLCYFHAWNLTTFNTIIKISSGLHTTMDSLESGIVDGLPVEKELPHDTEDVLEWEAGQWKPASQITVAPADAFDV